MTPVCVFIKTLNLSALHLSVLAPTHNTLQMYWPVARSVEIRERSMRYQGEISGDQREISERSGGDQPEISGDQ